MAEKNIQIKYVKGISKKNNNPYYAMEVSIPTVNGGYRPKMIFFNALEREVYGLKEEIFETKA